MLTVLVGTLTGIAGSFLVSLSGMRDYADLYNYYIGYDGEITEPQAQDTLSKDELNISETELMERFTRGDASRNTEGSGLGLAIARDLLHLMD